MAICTCPLPTELPDISNLSCLENFGQIVKIAFQRIDDTNNTFSEVTATNPIDLLASWTTFLSASDNTKITITPIFENFLIPAGESLTEGGNDNTTVDGAQVVVGRGFVQATGTYRMIPGSSRLELDEYSCENELGVYLINGDGAVIARWVSGTTPGTDFIYAPIPISNFYISDRDVQGYATQDKYNFSFNLTPGWSDLAQLTEPTDFNARTDLSNP